MTITPSTVTKILDAFIRLGRRVMTNERRLDRSGLEFDPSEMPVPLVGLGSGEPPADGPELIVQTERQAMAREDSAGTIQPIKAPAPEGVSVRVDGDGRNRTSAVFRRPVLGKAMTLLIAACMTMFVIGWRQGAHARGPAAQIEAGASNLSELGVTETTLVKQGASSTEGMQDQKSQANEEAS